MTSRRVDFVCTSCGDVRPDAAPQCPRCGGAYQMNASIETEDSAKLTETEELVGEESLPDSEALVFKSFAGMRSHATLSGSTLELTLSGPLDLGRRGDSQVADRVVSVLRSEGKSVEVMPHRDDAGEDRKIRCDGDEITIQVVTVPAATEFLREASRGSASTTVPISQAAAWINEAVSAKAAHYSPAQNAATLLAIDIRPVGVLASSQVARAVEEAFGNPCSSHGFGGIWLVGPLDSRCTRFPLSRW